MDTLIVSVAYLQLVLVAQPGGVGGGVAVPVDPAVAAGAPGQLYGGQADVYRRRYETAESPRAVGVAAAVLALLLAASSVVWALYKFKPGLVRDRPDVDVPPVYVVDQFYDTYRPPPSPHRSANQLVNQSIDQSLTSYENGQWFIRSNF